MTTSNDYIALITSEHADKPNFVGLVTALVQPAADMVNLETGIPASFDIDSAIGAQLDVVGVWVGISRSVQIPLTGVYFAFDTAGVGWDQGLWQGPYDPTSGLFQLDDTSYRTVLRAKIGSNQWDGALSSLQAILDQIFVGTGAQVAAKDNQDMTMTVIIAGVLPNAVLLSLLTGGYLVPKPMGVDVNYVTTSVSGTPVFGFDLQNQFIAGWDTGSWGI